MPMKELLHTLQPLQLYIVLTLSVIYLCAQLFLSHITHALTLLVDSYHMLCNIIALSGCIIAVKHSKKPRRMRSDENALAEPSLSVTDSNVEVCEIPQRTTTEQQQRSEGSLRNTFGWTRIDVLTMLIVCIFMASLCFSLLVEALQTLVHIDHQDAMHYPIPVLILGALGIVLNGLCYLLIGGYTFHQGSFLHITSSGEVILDRVVSDNSVRKGERRLSRTKRPSTSTQEPPHRQGVTEMSRDICSTIFVIICSIIVFFANDEEVSKFVDPIISIISCFVLLAFSYPYMKESCLILLQTIPATIDIESFRTTLLSTFPDIDSVHDLHIWQLTKSKYVSTVHIIFHDPKIYIRIVEDVQKFFHEQGISIVTIQPEFKITSMDISIKRPCLVLCQDNTCLDKFCCKDSSVNIKNLLKGSSYSIKSVSSVNEKNDKKSAEVCKSGTDSFTKPEIVKEFLSNLTVDTEKVVDDNGKQCSISLKNFVMRNENENNAESKEIETSNILSTSRKFSSDSQLTELHSNNCSKQTDNREISSKEDVI